MAHSISAQASSHTRLLQDHQMDSFDCSSTIRTPRALWDRWCVLRADPYSSTGTRRSASILPGVSHEQTCPTLAIESIICRPHCTQLLVAANLDRPCAFLWTSCVEWECDGAVGAPEATLLFGPWYIAHRPRSRLRFSWCSRVSFRLSQLFGRHGVFGIESPHYHTVHLIQQLVEATLQSYQAYRMSRYISRVWLNQLYVGLIIVSCWSIPLVKRIKARDPLRQRMLIILWDVLLDFVASIGISVVLLYSYLPDFDLANGTVWYYLWFNGHWVVHAISESQLMLVQSRMDLLTRATFSLGLLWCLENLKDLLESTHWRCSEPRVRPPLISAPNSAILNNSLKLISARTISSGKYLDVSWFRMPQRSFQGSLVLWGIIFLGLHVHTASRATIRQCSMQVRPWLTHRSACALLVVDCYATGISGDEREATAVWAQVNEGTVLRVLVRHCPKFHMSPQTQTFHELRGLNFYNSTITKWTEDAELTQDTHPNLLMTLFVRTNVTNGEIPRGFLSDNFPQSLMDVEFSVTNLRGMPDDVDTKWRKGGTYHFEYS